MSDRPVRTRVMADGNWWPLQEFLIRRRGEGPVQDVIFRNVRAAAPTPEVLAAIRDARAIVIGPSNPVISIGPILALPGLGEAITASRAPVVAVSPLVKGRVLKGPTEAFMRWARHTVSSSGIAAAYGLIHGLVADERTRALPVLRPTRLLADAEGRRRVAEQTLQFALGLRKGQRTNPPTTGSGRRTASVYLP
jgi:LPPG:FO 2-phospho-L-lactate transferase